MKRFILNFWSKYRLEIGATAIVAVLYFSFFLAGITCPIKFITGISCPGCGMSRACISALRFDFASAFHYHPLWIMIPFAAALLIVFKAMKKQKLFNITLYICAAVMLVTWLCRMIFLGGDVVVFTPSEGIVPRIIQRIIE